MDTTAAELIRAYYDAAIDDPTVLRSLIDARSTLISAGLSKGGLNSLQNSQKNGISFSVLVSLPETTRLVVINQAIAWIKRGIRPTSRTRGGFQNTVL